MLKLRKRRRRDDPLTFDPDSGGFFKPHSLEAARELLVKKPRCALAVEKEVLSEDQDDAWRTESLLHSLWRLSARHQPSFAFQQQLQAFAGYAKQKELELDLDQHLQILRKNKSIRMIKVPALGSEAIAIIPFAEYLDSVNNLLKDSTCNIRLRDDVTRIGRKIASEYTGLQISCNEIEEMLDTDRKSDVEAVITALGQLGLLLRKDVGAGTRMVIHSGAYWLSLPNLANISSLMDRGSNAITSILSKRRHKEITLSVI